MSPPVASSLAVLLAGLAACGHAAPSPSARSTSPAAEAASAPAAEPEPDAALAVAEADAPGPVASASAAAAAPAEGCTYVRAADSTVVGGISILGLGDAGGGFDMPDICPQQACTAGLTIELPKRGGWATGVYDLAIATDDGTLRCHHTASAPPAWSAPAHCAHQRELSADCVGPEPPWFGPIMVSGAPSRVRVTVALDGVTLADSALAPAYSSKRWDGWDCDPSCTTATARVDVR